MRKLLEVISFVTFLAGVFLMIGIAGGNEMGTISFEQEVFLGAVSVALIFASACALQCISNSEK